MSTKLWMAAELVKLPTIASGHFDNLKVEGVDDNGCQYRVFLSRCHIKDGAPYDNGVTIERLKKDGWKTVAEYAGGPIPKTYTARFVGRVKGAIGSFYCIIEEVEGCSRAAANLKLYEKYDHIQHLTLTLER